jgi:sulfatase maturation enzyme AslB (radical SAM superfamily)
MTSAHNTRFATTDDRDVDLVERRPPPFTDPRVTVKGEPRAFVPFDGLSTLWFNTGTLCNIACHNCYIGSSPTNDALVYLTRSEVARFLAEASTAEVPPSEIGFTGGEPFMNPDFIGMLEDSLVAGFRVLVLTNAMKPMQNKSAAFARLNQRFPGRISVRVSIDHYRRELHEQLRGARTWQPAIKGLNWLVAHGFDVAVAGRMVWPETADELRTGFARLFADHQWPIDANAPARLVLFPEMDVTAPVPEISVGCWSILDKHPSDMMCANSRMVVRHRGAVRARVVSCTLLPYDTRFDMGATLDEAAQPVVLNHSHCALFCVLGGASCSANSGEAGR